MNILVVGNGFDIAHGLRTSYSDFLLFLNTFIAIYSAHNKREDMAWGDKEDKTYVAFIIEMLREAERNEVYKDVVTELDSLVSDNIWLQHFNEVTIDNGWVDFEKEISRIIKRIDEAKENPKILINKNIGEFNNGIEQWAYQLLETIQDDFTEQIVMKNIKEHLLQNLNKLIRALEIYLLYYVEDNQLKKDACSLSFVKELDIDNILSFNYTTTYEVLYGNDKNNYDYIHGKANKKGHNVDTCNMVLGIDEYLDILEQQDSNYFIEFKKFYQRIYKRTGCKYRNWVEIIENYNKANPKAKKVDINLYFYGHSLDITDKDIIARLILQENTYTTIFYHNREALGKLISNLVAILGEEYVITNTGGLKPSIVFQAINEEEFNIVNK